MGTMRERSPGKWELVVSAGINPATGRYHRVVRTVATTSKREAKAALATLEAAVAAGNVSFDDPTLSSLLERWMEHITSLGRADTTLYHYRQYIDREIVPGARLDPAVSTEGARHRSALRKPPQARPGPGDHPPGACDPAGVVEPSRTMGPRPAQRCKAGLGACRSHNENSIRPRWRRYAP